MSAFVPKILFILPYPAGRAPSQRFRVEQFLPLLDEAGIEYKLAPFMNESTWNVLYKGGSVLQKASGIVKGYLKRWKHILVDIHRYNTIFIHREAAPLGPPVFEWIVAKLWRKKTIYDFDDAIWIPNTSAENKIAGTLKAFWKVGCICKWSAIVTAGNHFLADFAKQSGAKRIEYLPTVVDTDLRYIPKPYSENNNIPVIGWTGSHSTLKYLDEIIPILQELENEIDFKFLVIADKNPRLPLKNFEFIKWREATEIEDLQKIDIGIMPLTADKWSEGKCGFKLIQYMALGLPSVASPVGVNVDIIQDGINGFLCENKFDWKNKLLLLLQDGQLRHRFAGAGITTIRDQYSISSQKQVFLKILTNPKV